MRKQSRSTWNVHENSMTTPWGLRAPLAPPSECWRERHERRRESSYSAARAMAGNRSHGEILMSVLSGSDMVAGSERRQDPGSVDGIHQGSEHKPSGSGWQPDLCGWRNPHPRAMDGGGDPTRHGEMIRWRTRGYESWWDLRGLRKITI